jgi:hypothetical protein
MEGSFVPECYFDTVLVRSILQIKTALNHKKGCNNVVKAMTEGRLSDAFAVGIVDKDKKELKYLNEFDGYEFDNLALFKHRNKHHYIIQLIPPIEQWILKVAEEAKIKVEDFGLPRDIEKLKKITKSELAKESPELVSFCTKLLQSESLTVRRFANWIEHLRDNKYNADINQLKNG